MQKWNQTEMDHQSAFIFPGVPSDRHSIVKGGYIGNQSKCWWCHYSIGITLGNNHLLHNDTMRDDASDWILMSRHRQHICIGWCGNDVSISPWPWEIVMQPIRLSSCGANNLFQHDSSRTVVLCVVSRGTCRHCCVSHCAKGSFKPRVRHICRGLIGTAFQITSTCGLGLIFAKIASFFLSRLP